MRLPLLLAFASLVACSSSDPATATSTSTSGGGGMSSSTGAMTGGGGAGGGTGGSAPVCPPPGMPSSPAPTNVGTVTATILGTDETPAANQPVQLCGLDVCLYGTTNAQGGVIVPVNKSLDHPAFKYGEGLVYAKLAFPVPAGSTDLMTVHTAKLPLMGPELVAGAKAASNGVTIEPPAGSSVVIDELVYDTPDKQLFRAAEIPVALAAPALPASIGLEILYGVAPLETTFCPAAKVTVANKPGWAAGAEVELWIHGVDVLEEWVPYGSWKMIGTGHVSADGMTVSTDDDSGLPVLATFGFKLKG